ncbi:cell division topological specificity factor MinE [Aggregatilinea lenta]|uniref:cell division topological specificity factor MinE n=1 Tax=Aggregatilinea lenta TaxID=913108 RepID=UPI000E5A4C97|nr:cell division topological specificity factor MinE [Aggregatilinea lenta]
MASFFDRLFGRRVDEASADLARERLKLVLVTDRSDISPEHLAQMQDEIIEVIKRYLNVTEGQVHIKLEQRERKNYLVANIPLVRNNTAIVPDYVPAPVEAVPAPPTEPSSEPPAAEQPPEEDAAPTTPPASDTQPTKRRRSSSSRRTTTPPAEKPSEG